MVAQLSEECLDGALCRGALSGEDEESGGTTCLMLLVKHMVYSKVANN